MFRGIAGISASVEWKGSGGMAGICVKMGCKGSGGIAEISAFMGCKGSIHPVQVPGGFHALQGLVPSGKEKKSSWVDSRLLLKWFSCVEWA